MFLLCLHFICRTNCEDYTVVLVTSAFLTYWKPGGTFPYFLKWKKFPLLSKLK